MTTIADTPRNGFYAEHISANVQYNKGLIDYDVSKLDNIKLEKIYCKNSNAYILGFIEHMKTHIIKKLPKLNAVNIYLVTLDKGDILIRFMITITNMMHDILKIKRKLTFNKSIFVYITYENKIVFTGVIDFRGLD